MNKIYFDGEMEAKTWNSIVANRKQDQPTRVEASIRRLIEKGKEYKAKTLLSKNKKILDGKVVKELLESLLRMSRANLESELYETKKSFNSAINNHKDTEKKEEKDEDEAISDYFNHIASVDLIDSEDSEEDVSKKKKQKCDVIIE